MLAIQEIIQDNTEALGFSWIAAEDSTQHLNPPEDVSASDLVGHLNVIHPSRIQVFGDQELIFFKRKTQRQRSRFLEDLSDSNVPCIVFAESLAPPERLIEFCEEHKVPLVSSPKDAARVIDVLRAYLSRYYAPRQIAHGVFLDVLGVGVLITGESGLGKSELALELISRGHGLVADDSVELSRSGPTEITGRCPPLLRNILEVRGLGLLDICTIFGETSVRRKMRLHLIVHLSKDEKLFLQRIPTEEQTREILGVSVRYVLLQVAAGRNLAVLVEAAVRNTILKMRGIDTMQEFIQRQLAAIEENTKDIGSEQ